MASTLAETTLSGKKRDLRLKEKGKIGFRVKVKFTPIGHPATKSY
jgi:hypothetical protein